MTGLMDFLKLKSHGNPQTVKRYHVYIQRFYGWLQGRKIAIETINEYTDYLSKKYSPNSLIPMTVALNFYLDHKDIPALVRFRAPQKVIDPNPKLISQDEYEALLARISDPAEHLVVRLLHDTLLRPSDIASLRRPELDMTGKYTYIRKRTQKRGVNVESMLLPETARELKDYLTTQRGEYVFPSPQASRDAPRHRTWPNKVLSKYALGISPKTFRRTGATNWSDDLRSLMAQGGWNDPKTILRHYRRNVEDRHAKAMETAMGVRMTEDDTPDVPGYS